MANSIQDTDWLRVSRDQVDYKVEVSGKINDDDLLLVNRDGVDYRIRFDAVVGTKDDDLFLINRDGVDYRVLAGDLKEQLGI